MVDFAPRDTFRLTTSVPVVNFFGRAGFRNVTGITRVATVPNPFRACTITCRVSSSFSSLGSCSLPMMTGQTTFGLSRPTSDRLSSASSSSCNCLSPFLSRP